jgi:SHS2 domain-containing protein
MPYEHLDHEADVGIRGIGASWVEAFSEGARAMFSIMAGLEAVVPRESVPVRCEAPDLETLFVEFLNELLFQREIHGLLLSTCEVKVLRQRAEGWVLEALAWGEPLDPDHHEILTEVKAATYSGLKVFRQNGQYVVQCVVDV